MKGIVYILLGIGIILMASAGFVVLQIVLESKKKQIRKDVYQIYN